MDNSWEIPTIFHVLILCFSLTVHSQFTDNQKVIFSHCPNRTLPDPSLLPLISNLFERFTVQSATSSFFRTIVADEKTAISGLFQCRNGISAEECRACVSEFPALSEDLCGRTLPARIQLSGCYAHYQEEDRAGTETNSRPEQVLHRACSKRRIERSRFEEVKCEAFAALERCVMSENGYCEMNYKSVRVLGQCGGDLGHCDCGECVSSAVQIAGEDECRYSVSGEIYLESCFISYEYHRDREFGTFKDESGSSSPKKVAIVVGGLAVILLGIGLCYCLTSCGKKKDDW